MNMTIMQSIFMGLLTGFTELLPVSAPAHQALARCLLGVGAEDGVGLLICHVACLLALTRCCRADIRGLRNTRRLLRIPPKRRRHQPEHNLVLLLGLLRVAAIPLVLGRLLTGVFAFVGSRLQILAFTVAVNGVIVLLPALVRNGNKDQRNMSRLDALLMGLGAALSAIPGFSMLGCALALGIRRGVDRKFALRFAWLLMLPGLVMELIFDVLRIVGSGLIFSPLGLLGALLGGVFCYAGATAAHRSMDFLSFSSNFSAFSYYCFGVGLFSFLLFLIV